ncbi:bifunctional ADP-dependent (S)-NAD(P)H-hydrate dehydratase/NAD(P)H-hydrate epimerase [Methanomicrobiaceae archaeon CYW5]|uniref:NAD(P)H-hydrate dehydratase n=1 Tax=Methanovulcanius yangii TaxID=1789227 RepID=UPI0029C9DE5A|nr:NAD(P)H-hydrate dehydratase [Methanovulcanius yangii]MBT8507909.1 bifunctional ADP-dependent (S)-NAD(P)H-hydrate dehydratase/NAD(P)H-hydrate epimerase [Methanovulcanius yangii]
MRGLQEFCETGVISAGRMRAVDANAMALGVSSLQLMENAGAGLAGVARYYGPDRVLVLCGRGNNGGDGCVAARHLHRECEVTVLVMGARGGAGAGQNAGIAMATAEGDRNLSVLASCGVPVIDVPCAENLPACSELFEEADVIIDAMLGTGSSGPLREPYATAVMMANRSPAPVLAADVPTAGIVPDRICAFHRAKSEGAAVIDIGIPIEAECCTGPGDLSLVLRKDADAHKGAGGEVLIIGGGPYQGAPYLAGMAALRGGADIVRIATPHLLPCPDLIVEQLEGGIIGPEHLSRLAGLAREADVVVVGCGLGKNSHDVVASLAPACKKAVFDADALRRPLPAAVECIYTPHAGEFARMFGTHLTNDIMERARAVRREAGPGVVLAKGPTDIVSDGERVRFNRTGTPAMTVGGTGDILAGLVGALFCRLDAFDAACIGAHACGLAGEACAGEGDGLAATDLLRTLPGVLYDR